MMIHRSRSGLILGILTVAVMLPLFAASQLGPTEEPWPALLSQPAPSDPDYALLQDRANAALERVLQTDHTHRLAGLPG